MRIEARSQEVRDAAIAMKDESNDR
jgi:hypothetical protein